MNPKQLQSLVTILITILLVLTSVMFTGSIKRYDTDAFGNISTLLGAFAATCTLLFLAHQHFESKNTTKLSELVNTRTMIIGLILATTVGLLLGAFIQNPLVGAKPSFPAPQTETSMQLGDIATWVGATFTGIAAIGALFAAAFTRKTLKFLTKQHDDQRSLQIIQMYQAHKEAFTKLLDDLENTYDGKFKFLNRDGFYREIFPENNFHSFSPISIMPNEAQGNDFKDKIDCHRILLDKLPKCISEVDTGVLEDLVLWTFKFKNQLHVTDLVSMNGDVYLQPDIKFTNVFDIEKEINQLHYILQQILVFSGNKGKGELPRYYFPHFELLDYCLLHNGPKGLNLLLEDDVLTRELYKISTELKGLRASLSAEQQTLYLKLVELFKQREQLERTLRTQDEISPIISECITFLIESLPSLGDNIHVIEAQNHRIQFLKKEKKQRFKNSSSSEDNLEVRF